MKNRLLLLILTLLLARPTGASPPVGMVTDLRGEVRAGSVRLDVLTQLSAGQVLVLGPGARCTVTWFVDGHREKVSGPARVRVTPGGLAGASVTKVRAAAALASMQPRAPAGSARTAVTTRGEAEVVARLPAPARVAESAPLFRLPQETAAVEVRGPGGEVLVADRLVGDSLWAVPARHPETGAPIALDPGCDYELAVLDGAGRQVSSRRFRVVAMSRARQDRLVGLEDLVRRTRDDATPWIARAAVLEEAGLREQALDAVLEALVLCPSPALMGWAADLSEQMERPLEAEVWRRLAGQRR